MKKNSSGLCVCIHPYTIHTNSVLAQKQTCRSMEESRCHRYKHGCSHVTVDNDAKIHTGEKTASLMALRNWIVTHGRELRYPSLTVPNQYSGAKTFM